MQHFMSKYNILPTWQAFMYLRIFILTKFIVYKAEILNFMLACIWVYLAYYNCNFSICQYFLLLAMFVVFCSWICFPYNGLEIYVFVCSLEQYLYCRGQPYDCTRKWSWKKENKMFYVIILKCMFVCNLKWNLSYRGNSGVKVENGVEGK